MVILIWYHLKSKKEENNLQILIFLEYSNWVWWEYINLHV